ncbi:MAG TPA: porin family protein [Cytophagaceae bacterium]|jgi:hypothetical protein
MKKIALLFSFMLIFGAASFAQLKIGLNFSPALAFNRLQLTEEATNTSISTNGVSLKFIAGPELSFYIGDNYAFTTGIWYVAKRAGLNYTLPDPATPGTNLTFDNTYNLQYVQLPATFKLFTNEIATDMKLYFQVGGAVDIKVGEKLKGSNVKATNAVFKPIDASLIVGSGVELQMGENTYFLVGLRYTRGLINILKDTYPYKNVNLKADLVSIDLGIRF